MGMHIVEEERGERESGREFIVSLHGTNAKEIYTWDVELQIPTSTVLPQSHKHAQSTAARATWVNISDSVLSLLFFLLSFLLYSGSVFWWLATVEQKISNKFSSCACSHTVPLVAHHFSLCLFFAFLCQFALRTYLGHAGVEWMHFNGTENSAGKQWSNNRLSNCRKYEKND